MDPRSRLKNEITPIPVPEGITTTSLHIRNVNGYDALFTSDGKMLAGQSCNGHMLYINDPKANRDIKSFRCSFIVDNREVSFRGPVEV